MIKRPLTFAVVSFVLGILAAELDIRILFVCTLLLAAGIGAFLYYKKRAVFPMMLMTVFLLCGIIRADMAQTACRKTASQYDGQTKIMAMTVTDFSDEKRGSATFKENGKSIKVYFNIESARELYPGDIIEGEFTLREPFGSKTSVSDFSSYLKSRGIYLCAYAEDVTVAGCRKDGLMGAVYSVRRYINDVGFINFKGNSRALFNAMVLGDKHLMTDGLTASLQGAGLNHIAVVSGMHLSIIIALQMFLLDKLFGKRRIGNFLSIAGAIFITLATGAGASVIRACVMSLLYQAAKLFYRENDAITSLAAASGVMCAFNPYIIYNAGFVLSVLSVLGIVLYSEKMTALFNRFLPGKVGEAAALCIAAQLTVTPAVMHYFNIFTPYAIFANVLVFPFATAVVVTGMALGVFASIPVLCNVMRLLTKLLSDIIEYVCELVSEIPGATMQSEGLDALFMIVWIFILAVIYMYPKRKQHIKSAALMGAILIFAAGAVESAKEDDIRLSFLTYGANTSTAVQLPDGELLLIDCIDRYDCRELADRLGKKSYDCAILTSAKEEEILSLSKEGYVRNLILPKEFYSEKEKSAIINSAKSCNMRVDFLENGQSVFLSGAFLEYLPLEKIGNEKRCVKIEYKDKSFITLQGLDGREIEKLCSSDAEISADCVKLPFTVLREKTDAAKLTDGKLLQTEKEFNIK